MVCGWSPRSLFVLQENGLIHKEISAKTGEGVEELFTMVVDELAKKAAERGEDEKWADDIVDINKRGKKEGGGGCPC